MFHILYVVSVMFLVPMLFILGELYYKKRKAIETSLLGTFCKWTIFWAIGVRATSTGLMQALNPLYTSQLLNLTQDCHIVVQELGFAQLGVGILGLLSFLVPGFRKPASLSYGIFMIGAIILHLSRIHAIETGELISLFGDIFVVFIMIISLFAKERTEQIKISV